MPQPILPQTIMLNGSPGILCSLYDALLLCLGPLSECFVLRRNPNQSQEDGKEDVPDARHPLHSSARDSITHYYAHSTHAGRAVRHVLFLFGLTHVSPDIANSRDDSWLTPDAHSAFPPAASEYSTPIRSHLSDISRRLLCLSSRRLRTPQDPQEPQDPADICPHCHNKTGCSLVGAHALAPVRNGGRWDRDTQTSAGAFHSIYCIKCGRYCYVCLGPSRRHGLDLSMGSM
ncbi:hypothetical protein DFH06DRAFT_1337926 [Mycena polygramma]|nr:hypothetical protein DFH06DRAFT_1337926 [Mycena polygramma]